MTIERLVQKLRLGERNLAQNSMYDLIQIIAENKKAQEEIIRYFSEELILKMLSYLEDPDSYFRKLTAKFFLDLVYGNSVVQQAFCEMIGIIASDGKVCLNRIPESFKGNPKSLSECIDVLKKPCPEEARDIPPYCWYFVLDNEDHFHKNIDFIFSKNQNYLENLDNFIDPLYSVFGFVIRISKTKKHSEKKNEISEKVHSHKECETRRFHTSTNTRAVNSMNTSLDHSLHTRILNDSKSQERDTLKTMSTVVEINGVNGVNSSRFNYPKTTKAKIDNLMSHSVCSTERFGKLKFEPVSERNMGAHFRHIDRENSPKFASNGFSVERDQIKFLNNTVEIKGKKSTITEADFSMDNYEHRQSSQLAISNNESHEFSVKLLETSVCNSIANNPKVGLVLRSYEISPDVSQSRATPVHEKKSEISKKYTEKQEKTQTIRSKQLELDKKYMSNTFRDKNNHSFSATTTPKSTLLSKILKDKPIIKDSVYTNKQKAKQDYIKRLNATTNLSGIGGKHIPHKYSVTSHKSKGSSKQESDYNNKKYAFHSSLLKSIDVSDLSHGITQIEERDETIKENLQLDTRDRIYTQVDSKHKSYQISSIFKSPISTPRSPNENLRSNLAQNSKILNSRKSQDPSYLLYKDRRRTEVSIPLQSVKNRNIELKSTLTDFTSEQIRSITPKLSYK